MEPSSNIRLLGGFLFVYHVSQSSHFLIVHNTIKHNGNYKINSKIRINYCIQAKLVAALSKDTDLFTAVKRLFHECEKIVSQL